MVSSKPLPPPPPVASQLSRSLRRAGAKFVHIQDVSHTAHLHLSESLLGMQLPLDSFKKAWSNVLLADKAYDNTASVFRRLNAELNGVRT